MAAVIESLILQGCWWASAKAIRLILDDIKLLVNIEVQCNPCEKDYIWSNNIEPILVMLLSQRTQFMIVPTHLNASLDPKAPASSAVKAINLQNVNNPASSLSPNR